MKFFKNTISNWDEWETLIVTPLKEFYGEDSLPEFMDDDKAFYTQKQIYWLMGMNYNNVVIRYDNKDTFVEQMKLTMMNNLPSLYAATLAFVNNEFQKLLEAENRGDQATTSTDTLSKQKTKQGVPPSDLTVSSDLSDLNIKNAEYLENAIQDSTNTQTTNLLTNLKQIINSNINGVILDWLNKFANLFSIVVKDEFDWSPRLTDILYSLTEDLKDLKEKLSDNFDEDKTAAEMIATLQTSLASLQETVDSYENIPTEVTELTTKLNDLIQTVADNKTTANTELMDEVGVLTELINNVETQLRSEMGNYVDLSSDQTITGVKTFNTADKTENMVVSGNKTAFISFKKGTTRYGYVGLGSSSDNVIRIGSDQDQPIYLQPSNGVIYANGRITSLSTPTSDNDAATKQYVDDAIAGGTTANYATVEQLNELDTKVDANNMTLQSNIDTNTTNINALGETLEQWVTLNDEATVIKNTEFTGGVSSTSTPTEDNDLTTKAYVDSRPSIKTIYTDVSWTQVGSSSTGKIYIGVCSYLNSSNSVFPEDFDPDSIINCWFPNEGDIVGTSSNMTIFYRWLVDKSSNRIMIRVDKSTNNSGLEYYPAGQLMVKYAS